MNLGKTRITTALSCAALAGSGLLVGCQNEGEARPATASSSEARPHGHVEGAEEAAEQQLRLVLAGAGAAGVLDLTTGEITSVKGSDGVTGLRTDGRFAYVSGSEGTRVIDTGSWTVDHGDHTHYYRAAVRDAGSVAGHDAARVHGDPAVTAVTSSQGSTRLFDRQELEGGAAPRGRALTGAGGGPVVPYAGHLLAAGAEAGEGAVEVLDRSGSPVASLEEPCAQARGEAVTRRGVVFGCADGALLVSEESGEFRAEKIPYGTAVDASERAADFRHRAGSTTLVAPAGEEAVWVLDVADRSWTRVETGPVTAANTAGEGAPLLTLGEDGALSAFDITTGKRTAHKELLAEGGAPAVIEVDTTRAYVNDAAARKVYEIDYNDRLRLARTFPLDFAPTHMVETGR
ncbi:hypothetical protein [Streptomyces pratensis]|uniref:hypothetical protein n=1 Tax=Streptomyces pratensis TaxID=1169025 RepID=UPI0030175924